MRGWQSSSPNVGKLVITRNLWIIGIPLLLIAILMVYFGLSSELPVIVSWALVSTLALHCMCVRHYLLIDKNKGKLIHHLGSLYPIGHEELPLEHLAGFCIARTATRRHFFTLIAMMDNGQRITLFSQRSLSQMEDYAQLLGNFCQRPYRVELTT